MDILPMICFLVGCFVFDFLVGSLVGFLVLKIEFRAVYIIPKYFTTTSPASLIFG